MMCGSTYQGGKYIHLAKNQRSGWTALVLVVLMATSTLPIGGNPATMSDGVPPVQHAVLEDTTFATSDGFVHINVTTSQASGITSLQRPPVSWTTPTTGNGLSNVLTGSCSVYLQSTDEVYLLGGRIDPNPTQTGDETPTNTVDIFDLSTNSWTPAPELLNSTQQYHGCAVVNGVIYSVGDHYPNSNPATPSTGMVQTYNPLVGSWTLGTNMPSGKGVGLAGVTSMNGFLYVAGGVSKPDRSDLKAELLRYDPVNDQWNSMANMSHPRHSFELVPFRGKLVAFGGIATFFDPAANATVTKVTNLTEAYDPVTNTWSPLPNATHQLAAYAAEVFNDEIVVLGGITASGGWSTTASDKTYGYDPTVNRWRTHATLPISLYDSTLVRANNTLVYASGDTSNTRFGTWSIQYTADNEYFTNPSERSGWLTSSVQRLTHTTEGSASLTWIDVHSTQPSGTFLGVQYRTAGEANEIAVAPWKPTVVPIYSYLPEGNNSMVDSPLDHDHIQYRAKLTTTALMSWETPTLDSITIGADEASFVTTLPSTMQPTSAPINITTHHHASSESGTYTLGLRAQTSLGNPHTPSEWTTMKWNTSTEHLDLSDTDSLVFDGRVNATLGPMTPSGQTVTWSFSLASELPSEHLRFMVQTNAERNVTYLHESLIGLDREVEVNILGVRSNSSSVGGPEVNAGEVLPGNAELTVTLQHVFANSGLALMGGAIEGRLHTDVLTHGRTVTGERIWLNESSNWFLLPSGGEPWDAVLQLPESIAGDARLSLEIRTAEEWTLLNSAVPLEFKVNGVAPVVVGTSPADGTYTNEASERLVTVELNDVGGFSNETVDMHVWVQAIDDGSNGGVEDGLPQRSEYRPTTVYIGQLGNRWFLNTSVNDTANDDHEMVHILLEGTDLAGLALPPAPPDRGHLHWASRTPNKANLSHLEPQGDFVSSGVLRLEPSRQFGWDLHVVDTNSITDLQVVEVRLGGDDRLGFLYNHIDGTCGTLDQRILMRDVDCIAVSNESSLQLSLTGHVEWGLRGSDLEQGRLDVRLRDIDGLSIHTFNNAWSLQRELSISVDSLTDDDGRIVQPITENVAVMSGDGLSLRGIVTHRLSNTPYDGELRLRWNGLQQNSDWRGTLTVNVVNGQINTTVPTPSGSGLMRDVTLSLWDPFETVSLAEVDVPFFRLDGLPPELIPSNMASSISRYHLDSIDVGVNIREGQGWSDTLSMTCQIRSTNQSWAPQTLVRNSTTVFDGNTMFTFQYNMTSLGDPSTLPAQASLACWVVGYDDAGWALVSSGGNTELDPWMTVPLNNIGPDLSIESVEVDAEVAPGERVAVKVLVANRGESLQTPFNVSIEVIQGDRVELVGKAQISSINLDTATSISRGFDAPEGSWSLRVTVDQEGTVWEVNEGNNEWINSYTTSATGFGGTVAAVGGTSLLVLIVALVLRRRGASPAVNEAELKASMAPEPLNTGSTESGSNPAEHAPSPDSGPRGPPGGKVALSSTAKPKRGPPRAAKEEASIPLNTKEMAAQHFDALGPSPTIGGDPAENVEDYTQLPPGGAYDYSAEGTFYVGDEHVGRWRLNDDKSFTKISD